MNKKLHRITGVLIAAGLAFSMTACGGSPDPEAQVASVNDTVITQRDVDSFSVLYMYMQGYDPVELTGEEKQAILEKMVDTEVIRQYYESAGYTDDNYDSDLETFIAGVKSSEGDFIEQYEIADDDLSDFYRSQYLTQSFFTEIRSENSEEDMYTMALGYYDEHKDDYAVEEEVRVSAILVDMYEKAEQLEEELAGGADFAASAQEHSLEANSASNGGDMGYFTEEEMASEYGDGIFELETGQISQPVKTDDGYVIIKITDRNDTGYKSFEEVTQDIYYALYEELYDKKIGELKEDMEIEVGKVG